MIQWNEAALHGNAQSKNLRRRTSSFVWEWEIFWINEYLLRRQRGWRRRRFGSVVGWMTGCPSLTECSASHLPTTIRVAPCRFRDHNSVRNQNRTLFPRIPGWARRSFGINIVVKIYMYFLWCIKIDCLWTDSNKNHYKNEKNTNKAIGVEPALNNKISKSKWKSLQNKHNLPLKTNKNQMSMSIFS